MFEYSVDKNWKDKLTDNLRWVEKLKPGRLLTWSNKTVLLECSIYWTGISQERKIYKDIS